MPVHMLAFGYLWRTIADADDRMQVWHSLAEANAPRAVTTLGFFDGLHVGHQHLLQQVRTHAAQHGVPAVVVTLWPHPRIVLGHAPHKLELINDLESKIALLAQTGIDGVVVLDFTLEMAARSAGDFLTMIYQSPLAPSAIFMGYDHRFGHGGSGDFTQLEAFARAHLFEAYQAEPVSIDRVAVSSTLIRESVQQGHLERAMRYMGRPFAFTGTVGRGFQLGQELGFPTANVQPRGEWQLLPGHGVYIGSCRLPDGKCHWAVINVGTRPTVNASHAVSIEAHLLGYSGNLYDACVELTFLHKLRDELKFSTLAALKAQIAHDVAAVAKMSSELGELPSFQSVINTHRTMDQPRRVRVRFAPSPTGPLHIGGVRTALFNYLFARQHGGDFLLRIEDTDSSRYVPGAEAYIFGALRWCGMRPDEGVEEGGAHAPYRQSERKELYFAYAQQLVSAGWAYYAFDDAEELSRLRGEAEATGKAFAYGPATRMTLRNSLTLPADEVERLLSEKSDWVVRFKIPAERTVRMRDLIRGEVEVQTSTLDDKVLYKRADGLPTYHLANIVDDHLMEISHVIRGEEWLPSLPLHYLLYEAFGWQDTMPEFAHLPLILKPTGNGKLSKRDGDKMGFPVFPLAWRTAEGEVYQGYREDGYLPEAFLNMLALLGWNPGNGAEIMSLDELISQFSLVRVSKAGARFDPEKTKWFNHEYVQKEPAAHLVKHLAEQLSQHGCIATDEQLERAVELVRDRVTLLPDLWSETDYLWQAPTEYDAKAMAKHLDAHSSERLRLMAARIAETPLESSALIALFDSVSTELQWPKGKLMNSLRLALVGASRGIDVATIIMFLGVDETVARLHALATATEQ